MWKFLSLAQELLLLSIINSPRITSDLISVYQGCGFLNFNMFDSILAMLPDELMGNEDYNALDDNSQYHPSLSGKQFLTNVGCNLLFAVLSVLGFAACVLLSMRFQYFRGLKESYIFGGIICTVQSTFIDVMLAACVQMKDVLAFLLTNACIAEQQLFDVLHNRLSRGGGSAGMEKRDSNRIGVRTGLRPFLRVHYD